MQCHCTYHPTILQFLSKHKHVFFFKNPNWLNPAWMISLFSVTLTVIWLATYCKYQHHKVSHTLPFKPKHTAQRTMIYLLWILDNITTSLEAFIFYCTWWSEALQGLWVAESLEVVNQLTCGTASFSHQPQQHAARASLQLQHLQRAHLHVVWAGQRCRRLTARH